MLKIITVSYILLLIAQVIHIIIQNIQLYIVKKKDNGKINYNKYIEKAFPSDIVFQENDYTRFQFMKFYFKSFEKKNILQRLTIWSFNTWSLSINYRIITDLSSTEYLRWLNSNTTPKTEIKNTTHLVLLFPKEKMVTILMDHYYCDGIVMFNMLKHLTNYEGILPTPKYKYFPFLTEIVLNNFLVRNYVQNLLYPSQLNFSGDPVFLNEEFDNKTISNFPWNRWFIYARGLMHAFNGCPKYIKYFNIAFTVGINVDNRFKKGNNRIGCIIIKISKPNNFYSNSYEDNFNEILNNCKNKIKHNSKDAIVSYHLLQTYPTYKLRKYFSQNIDIVFTAFKVNDYMPQIIKSQGGFFGKHKFYIGGCTFKTRCSMNISTTVKGWDSQSFLAYPNTHEMFKNVFQ